MSIVFAAGLFANLRHAYDAGGWVMHVITFFMIMSYAVFVERFIALFIISRDNKDGLLRGLHNHILRGDVPAAIRFIDAQRQGPIARIVKAGLLRVNKGDREVQAALDEASLREVPYIEKRTGYLATFGNSCTLLGLLGTILGLIDCFAAVAHVDPANKATVLAAGMAVAMYTTAYGLIAAIPILILFALVQQRTQFLLDGINESVVSVMNLALANKQALKNANVEEAARAR